MSQQIKRQWTRFTMGERLARFAVFLGFALALSISLRTVEVIPEFLYDAPTQVADLLSRMWPLDLAYYPQGIHEALVETLHIATLGTVFTVFLAFPVAILAAQNTTFNKATWFLGRFILVTSRSVNTVVWGLLFVAIFGPGPVAGIFSVAARSIGFVGKLIAEAIEEIDVGTVEAVEATGASNLQTLLVGVLPQVMPVVLGTIIYRWDINIRESTVLGCVGAGGIGIVLYSSINLFAWHEVSVILISIFGVVILSEYLSIKARARIT
mgnify:CR=1 FL=1